MLSHLVSFLLTTGGDLVLQNDDNILPTATQWVDDNIINFLTPNVVAFLAALAAISVFRSLMRF